MTVKRVVTNVATTDVAETRDFYAELFDLTVVMDHGWIVTLAGEQAATVQVSIASEGGSGTPVPDLSIEVDDVDAVYERARGLGHDIPYALTDEAWGVRRFCVRDPTGKLLNVLAHAE